MNLRLDNGLFLRITEIYVFITIDKNGHEGIMAAGPSVPEAKPMIFTDENEAEKTRAIVERLAEEKGFDYELRTYSIFGKK